MLWRQGHSNAKDWPTGEVDGHNPQCDFATQSWPTAPGAFSFNIDPSPSKQLLRSHRDKEEVRRFAQLAVLRHPGEELYDLEKGPEQLRNVADDSNYREAKQRLHRKLDAELLNSNEPRLAAAGNRD